jgi:hypothetical protein
MTIYRLHTPASRGRPLEAWTLAELAELVGCAIAEGDPIERISALDPAAPARWLAPDELYRLLVLLTGWDG